MAQNMAQDAGKSAMADVASRMGMSAGYAQQYRKRLREAGVIYVPQRDE